MPKISESFEPESYVPVADRVALFYTRYPTGRIITDLVGRTENEITFRAMAYRSAEDQQPASTGWATERIGDGEINTVACLENTETSAIGRALANLGLTASKLRPSREEMEKADRARRRLRVAEATAGTRKTVPKVNEDLQRAANATSDALIVLAEADRSGLDSERSQELREELLSPRARESDVRRTEQTIRRWLTEPEHDVRERSQKPSLPDESHEA